MLKKKTTHKTQESFLDILSVPSHLSRNLLSPAASEMRQMSARPHGVRSGPRATLTDIRLIRSSSGIIMPPLYSVPVSIKGHCGLAVVPSPLCQNGLSSWSKPKMHFLIQWLEKNWRKTIFIQQSGKNDKGSRNKRIKNTRGTGEQCVPTVSKLSVFD